MRRAGWTDEQVEQLLGWALQIGVVLAALVGLIGGAAYLHGHGPQPYDYRIFRGEPADLRSLGGIVRGVSRLDARDVEQLGVVLLLVTPITRVALSALAFARQRDGTYVLVTSFVLVVLLVGLLGACQRQTPPAHGLNTPASGFAKLPAQEPRANPQGGP